MKTSIQASVVIFLVITSISLFSQNNNVNPSYISKAIYFDKTGPLKDFPTMTAEDWQRQVEKAAKKDLNKGLGDRIYPYAESALPKGPDPVWQKEMGTISPTGRDLIQQWDGINSPYYPPDCNGAVGSEFFFQAVNTSYSIFDKSGNQVIGATPYNTLFAGVPGSSHNDGDPIILYDDQADRWLAAEFAGVSSSPDYMLIAVSETDDPTGSWYRWSFVMNGFPDYMKFGVWRDGYYMSANSSGNDIYVFERTTMLAGGASPSMVGFNNPNRPNSGFHCIQPLDNDGQFAPVGTPGLFITINDDSWGGSDQLWMFELNVDWNTPANSTFARTQMIDVDPFDSQFNAWGVGDITQPGTSQKLDAIPMILMYRAQYRNFGSSENIVVCHTVDVNSTNWAGIRWYELEKAGSNWSVRQQGTYAPDSDNRWMGSIAMNGNHEIGLAYSVSSNSTHPSIRYTGQSSPENTAATGILDYTEVSILEGTNSQTSANRWGDYSLLSVDPDDDHTFWFTTEYIGNGGSRKTKIAAFEFAPPPLSANFEANPVSGYASLVVNFADLSTGEIDTWLWNFGDGNFSTSSNPAHTYTEVGLYSVSLTISNNSENSAVTFEDYIEVIQPPDPPISDFTADVTSGMEPLTVNFIDLSSNEPLTWHWEFGDGSWSNTQNPTFTYYTPGIYDVTLTTTGLGGSSDTEIKEAFIEVTTSSPQPEFSGTPTIGVVPLNVIFNDMSDGIVESWLWDFGDGNTSADQNPDHFYTETGVFSVSLTVSGPGGAESLVKEEYIMVLNPLSLEVSAIPNEICYEESSQLHAEVSGGLGNYSYSWTSDPEGYFSDEQSIEVSPDLTTTYMVEVIDGEQMIYGEIEVTVHDLPEIELVDWPEALCNQEEPPVQLIAAPAGGVFSGDHVSQEGVFSPEEAELGWNVIGYSYENEFGCQVMVEDSIFIDNCVGIATLRETNEEILIYPNPNSGEFTVVSETEVNRIQILSQDGSLLKDILENSKKVKINVNLSSGIYILIIKTEKNKNGVVKEFVIK